MSLNACPAFILQLENGPRKVDSVHMYSSFLSLKRNSYNSQCVFLSAFICRVRTARCVRVCERVCERLYVYARVCVKCGQVCGGVLIYFVMFVMCVLTDLKVLHHTALLICLFLLFAFTGVML